MILHALEIPADNRLWAEWLEQQLASDHLGELVAEMRALQGEPAEEPIRRDGELQSALDNVLGSQKPQVLSSGLGSLSTEQLTELFDRPALLLALQELVLRDGDDIWLSRLKKSAELNDVRQRSWNRLEQSLDMASSTVDKRVAKQGWVTPALVSSLLTLAAGLLLAYFVKPDVFRPTPVAEPAQVAWGWSKPDAFDASLSRQDYLRAIAKAAEDWQKKRPIEPLALAQRIAQFRQGCTTLILTDHKPLTPDDQMWLKERCQKWAAGLDTQLAALEAGDDPAKVQAATDEIVNKLIKAINERAAG